MTQLCITLLPNDRADAIPAEMNTTIKATPSTDSTDYAVGPLMTTVPTDSIFEVRVVYFLYVF